MKLRPGDACVADIYTLCSICGPGMVRLGCIIMEKLIKNLTLVTHNEGT